MTRLHQYQLDDPTDSQVLIRNLASPINPADINQLEGVYPSRPKFSTDLGTSEPSAVGGNEGLFEVFQVGPKQSNLKVGDWVLPKLPNFGTWRSHALTEESDLVKVTKDGITLEQAATVSVNPSTAYLMLKLFTDLNPGDWFIQNGANSAVGRAAIQIAKSRGINSINVVRSRDNLQELVDELTLLGATHVITEEESGDREFSKTIKEWIGSSSIQLALNCVGGKSSTNIARKLGHGGHLVTYGGMSKKPISLPTSLFIFKSITCHGFWMTEITNKRPNTKVETIEEIFNLYRKGEFKDAPVQIHKTGDKSPEDKLQTFQEALSNSLKGFSGKKQVVVYE